MLKKISKFFLFFLLVSLIFYIGFVLGDSHARGDLVSRIGGKVVNKNKIPSYLSHDVDYNLLWEVRDIINKNYVDRPVSETQLFYGALAGEVASLGDPYSVFLNPDVAQEFSQELSSEFEGIGAEVGIKKGILTVISPLPDSPAEKAGLKAGDKIYKIDGKETISLTLNEAVSLIRGKAGTPVVLTVIRKGEPKEIDIKIIRGKIHFSTVKSQIKEGGILYIKISHFNEDTARLFRETLREKIKGDIKGIVLDLRNNPGGFLEVAVDIAGHWISKGEPIVKERFSQDNQDIYPSHGNGELANFPTVTLVNGGSASASEILAGALQDYGLAVLVGEKTFGKGSVQQLFSLSDGSQIKLTIAKWLTPKGRIIEEKGLEPDIQIELTEDDYDNDRDPQLDKALEIIKSKIK